MVEEKFSPLTEGAYGQSFVTFSFSIFAGYACSNCFTSSRTNGLRRIHIEDELLENSAVAAALREFAAKYTHRGR